MCIILGMQKKEQRAFEKQLVDEGLSLVSLTRTRGGHYKAVVRSSDGRELSYFMAASASDHRAAKNRLGDIKRFFNN